MLHLHPPVAGGGSITLGGEQHLSGLKCRNPIVKEKNEQEPTDAACGGNLGKRSARGGREAAVVNSSCFQ